MRQPIASSNTLPFSTLLYLLLLPMIGCGGDIRMDMHPEAVQSSGESRLIVQSNDHAMKETNDSNETTIGKIQRRIVYDSQLSLVVKDYTIFESAITKLVESHRGFIAKSETNRRYESRQSGTWVARIPAENYTDFLTAVGQLGFAESRSENAQDITAEYVDVEARIRNNQQLEQRVLEMLEERTGKLSDVLEIERELARVRDEIERMQGRLRVLRDQSSLATITLQVREEKAYIPSAAPTLGTRVSTTWRQSLSMLRQAGESCLIATVAVVPWVLVIGFFAGAFYVVIRWLWRVKR
jgi:hypothetical protein